MDAHKNKDAKNSVFSGLFQQSEPPPSVHNMPAVSQEQAAELQKKIAALEKQVAEQGEKLTVRFQPPPPPPQAQKIAGLESKVAELADRLVRLEDLRASDATTISVSHPVDPKLLKKEMMSLSARIAAIDELLGRLRGEVPGMLMMEMAPVEGRLKSLEDGLAGELKARYATMEFLLREAVSKARIAHDVASGVEKVIGKMEERLGRLSYLESRLGKTEEITGRIYEVESAVGSMSLRLSKSEQIVGEVRTSFSGIEIEQEKHDSELLSLGHKVAHLSALFNYFKSELSFLLPKKQESRGD